MRLINYFLLLITTVSFLPASAQKLKKADKQVLTSLQAHVAYLADDKLEGRRTGTPGEKLAMEYISGQFRQIGLLPKGTNEYYQPFDIHEGRMIGDKTLFRINDTALMAGTDFFPLAFSAEKGIDTAQAPALQEAGMPWFVELGEILEENEGNPHFDLFSYLQTNTDKAIARGATAILFYNLSDKEDKLSFTGREKVKAAKVPVIYITKKAAQRFLHDPVATLDLKLNVALPEKKRTGHNVIGYIDNKAPHTVVIGAHYDHLGYGEDGNSLHRTGEKLVHNGADDNASGTASLIELARLLRASKNKSSNYLFLAFSGEELGLFGSKYFTENPTVPLQDISYMINMDMVGRLDRDSRKLSIGGYGTSPVWASVINKADKKLPFTIHTDSSGTGPSDHTSFYLKDIPVLFFFTGGHAEYHRPGDDAALLNYEGMLHIVHYINNMVMALNKQSGKLAFTKTRQEAQRSTGSFKVSLGIMPDYTFSEGGIKADAVTPGRPAEKAGLKAGDIIVQVGTYPTQTMQQYMDVLNKFNKGDKTTVRYKRGTEIKEAPLEF